MHKYVLVALITDRLKRRLNLLLVPAKAAPGPRAGRQCSDKNIPENLCHS